MIDIIKAKYAFKKFLELYKESQNEDGFELKVIHTYHVAENSKELAKKLKLNDEDIKLAELIGLLHDIGRFEELKVLNKFDGTKLSRIIVTCVGYFSFRDGEFRFQLFHFIPALLC